jgi:alpha-galactosidase
MPTTSPTERLPAGAVAEIAVETATAQVYEHGWQSWSPTTAYGLTDQAQRPLTDAIQVMNYRAGRTSPPDGFHGEGLLCVRESDHGEVHVFATPPGADPVPSITARVDGGRVLVSADGPVDHVVDGGVGGLQGALGRWADGYARAVGVAALRPAPTLWCSWYYYWTQVTEQDVLENLEAMDDLDVPVDVVQLDDGYQTEIGDWLSLSGRFESLVDLADRIHQQGRRAGIWVAPFLVGEKSRLFAEHPDWLVEGGYAGRNW